MSGIGGKVVRSVPGLTWACLILSTPTIVAAEPEPMRRGLIATYRDESQPNRSVTRLEPTVALSLASAEAIHPQLAPDGSAVWTGHLNISRAGRYRFAVRLRGEFRLVVAGKELLKATHADPPILKEGEATELEAGVHPFIAEFKRKPGAAVVELLWTGPGFRTEPLPFDVVGHLPKEESQELAASSLADEGRFLFEESSCVRCHVPDDKDRLGNGLNWRAAPDLSRIGARAQAGWIARWLDNPQKLRPGAAMPRLFTEDEGGSTERYAVATYLAKLGGPIAGPRSIPANELTLSQETGQRLFRTIGCVACHDPDAKPSKGGPLYGPRKNHPLAALGSKTTSERLAEYLVNPHRIDPSGRMPAMRLDAKEALDLARFLCSLRDETIRPDLGPAPTRGQMNAAFKRVDPRPDQFADFEKLPPAAAWIDLGRRIIIDRGCNNCHVIEEDGKPFAAVLADRDLNDLKKMQSHTTGCLADKADPRSHAPRFAFDDNDRKALREFLSHGLSGTGSPAPAFTARTELRRFNCLACHPGDGEGGLKAELVEMLKRDEKADHAETVEPPSLTGVAHKLRGPWMSQVLGGSVRARPWLAVRMPQFGEPNVGKLPAALAAAEGTELDDAIFKVAADEANIAAGRTLIGNTALGCVSCHDIAGRVSGGARGPDLALMTQRVRYEWYRRLLEQPRRIQPGTRMPDAFFRGKSLYDKLYNGNADKQAEAIWAYLSLGPKLQLP
jgi:mono/diheme cytochrome c family protein